MDELGVLANGYGFRPAGEAAPMGVRSGGRYSDVFGGPPKYTGESASSPLSSLDYDSIFNSSLRGAKDSRSKPTASNKPVYDVDIFNGAPGLKSKPTSSSSKYNDDVFTSAGINKKSGIMKNGRTSGGFDGLLPGFGSNRPLSEATWVRKTTPNATRPASSEGVFPGSHKSVEPSDDIWITVSEVPLFTKPTSAPPPSRPPPPTPGRASRSEAVLSTLPAGKKSGDSSSCAPRINQYSQSPKPTRSPGKRAVGCQIDELRDFTTITARSNDNESEQLNTNSSGAAASAAAMKEAMDVAEAEFKHAREVRDREYIRTSRTKEAVQLEKDEQAMPDDQEREYRGNLERLDCERLPRENQERERRRLEKDREKAREIESEREKAKQVMQKATREARERVAAEARERAAAEVRLQTERIAVHKVQLEARERAAIEARERAEKVVADAREKANVEARDKEVKERAVAAAARAESEARRRAERAAVEKASAEARERAAAEAKERAAAARMNQQKNDDDLESFFNMSRPEVTRKTSPVGFSSNERKASSAINTVDELTSIFGAAPSSGEFQNIDGESDERRRARLERHQRTKERAAKALAEKNQRDLQTQREQDERHRIGETLDIEIRRWAAGKEGNLRALLATMQYVLWPECGWQSVSLTDLIDSASVKRVYRKATLCIHPDKVQQKGATLRQKYIAEKVFDLLKEAWNKFNAEVLL